MGAKSIEVKQLFMIELMGLGRAGSEYEQNILYEVLRELLKMSH